MQGNYNKKSFNKKKSQSQIYTETVGEITSIDTLKGYMDGVVLRFPDFSEGQPFVARIKRPSILALTKSGKIPNELLVTANKLFAGQGIDENKESSLKYLFDVMDVLCEACFLEPTYKEIKDAGIELTDEQLMFVFNYSQRGTKALKSFRFEQANNICDSASAKVQKATVRNNKD